MPRTILTLVLTVALCALSAASASAASPGRLARRRSERDAHLRRDARRRRHAVRARRPHRDVDDAGDRRERAQARGDVELPGLPRVVRRPGRDREVRDPRRDRDRHRDAAERQRLQVLRGPVRRLRVHGDHALRRAAGRRLRLPHDRQERRQRRAPERHAHAGRGRLHAAQGHTQGDRNPRRQRLVHVGRDGRLAGHLPGRLPAQERLPPADRAGGHGRREPSAAACACRAATSSARA